MPKPAVSSVSTAALLADIDDQLSLLVATTEAERTEALGLEEPTFTSAFSSAAAGPSPPPPLGFASLIVADFPPLFAEGEKRWIGRDSPPGLFVEFRWKRFTLLWRGSRDGFGAGDFHRRCDRHTNTFLLILDTAGNIFGGFTPVMWESPLTRKSKFDLTLKSFLFTLKNPHNLPARKFALKPEKKDEANYCWSSWGPDFRDIAVSDNCNANTDSYTSNFGLSYANDTGRDGKTFFTGSEDFIVKEIEVFEITD
jgi:hypothetical protein